MNDITYKVDEKSGTVVCKLSNCENIALNRILTYCNDYNIRFSDFLIRDTYIGVARCMPGDSFDVEYGKKLALTRAKIKRGRAINRVINKHIKKCRRNLDILEEYGIHKIPEIEER